MTLDDNSHKHSYGLDHGNDIHPFKLSFTSFCSKMEDFIKLWLLDYDASVKQHEMAE